MMRIRTLVPRLGAASLGALLAGLISTAPVTARGYSSETGCVFCLPRYAAVDPTFAYAPRHRDVQIWVAQPTYPYSRMDIEGIRRLQRMP